MARSPDPQTIARWIRERVRGPVYSSPERCEPFARDAGIFRVPPLLVVEPADGEDIRVVLGVAAAERIGVTARGGGSGTGGAAVGEGIVLWFRPGGAFSVLGAPVGAGEALRITAGAAVRHDALQGGLARAGYFLPSDPSSGPLSVVGGNIGTRASGPHALRYGAIDRYLTGLRFLMADGTLVDTDKPHTIPARIARVLADLRGELEADTETVAFLRAHSRLKTASGYNLSALLEHAEPGVCLTALLAGSVGTLGIVLDATFRPREAVRGRAALLICLGDLGGACRLAAVYRDLGAAAVEIMDARSVELVRSRRPDAGIPGTPGHVLMVEMDGPEALDRAYQGAEAARRSGEALVGDPEVRASPEEIGGLWKARKLLLPLLRGLGGRTRALSVVNDVGVPPERLDVAIREIEGVFSHHGLEAFIYGHAGDGNLHLRPLFDLDAPGLKETVLGVAEDVYGAVVGLGGTVTGEHGMGRLRAPWLRREWGPKLYGIMERLKTALDPAGILNPGATVGAPALEQSLDRYLAP